MPALDRKLRAGSPVLAIQVQNYVFDADDLMKVRNVEVEMARGKTYKCKIEMSDPDINLADRPIFRYGNSFTVVSGWDWEPVILGPFVITQYFANYPKSGDITYSIEGMDKSVSAMHQADRSATISAKLASLVVQETAESYGMRAAIYIQQEDDILFDNERTLTQSGETDARLLQRLADRMGYVWEVDNNVLYFYRPEKLSADPVIMEYRSGKKSIQEFKPSTKPFKGTKKTGGPKKVTGFIDFLSASERAVGHAQGIAFNGIASSAEERYSGSQSDGGQRLLGIVRQVNGLAEGSFGTPIIDPELAGSLGNAAGLSSKDGAAQISGSESKERRNRFPNQGNEDTRVGDKKLLSETAYFNFEHKAIHTHKNFGYEQVEHVRADAGNATPQNKEEAQQHVAKQRKNNNVPIEATLKPTVPSWKWNPKQSVFVKGVGSTYVGIYEIEKVRLSYDAKKGLTTTLDLKKRTIGSSKKPKKETDTPQLSAEEAANPRKSQKTDKESLVGPGAFFGFKEKTIVPILLDAGKKILFE